MGSGGRGLSLWIEVESARLPRDLFAAQRDEPRSGLAGGRFVAILNASSVRSRPWEERSHCSLDCLGSRMTGSCIGVTASA